MDGFMLAFAQAMPKSTLALEIRKYADRYLQNPTESNWQTLESIAAMVPLKSIVEEKGGVEKAMQIIEDAKEGAELIGRLKGIKPDGN